MPFAEMAAISQDPVDPVPATTSGRWLTGQGVYLNFTEGEERVAEARNAFDYATWARLAAVKAGVDPGDMFAHGIDLSG